MLKNSSTIPFSSYPWCKYLIRPSNNTVYISDIVIIYNLYDCTTVKSIMLLIYAVALCICMHIYTYINTYMLLRILEYEWQLMSKSMVAAASNNKTQRIINSNQLSLHIVL